MYNVNVWKSCFKKKKYNKTTHWEPLSYNIQRKDYHIKIIENKSNYFYYR